MEAASLVDLKRYPINEPESAILCSVVDQARRDLADDGCARVSGFIHPDSCALLAQETSDLTPKASHSVERYTPYGSGADLSFPEGHPRRRDHRTTSGSVTRDRIPVETAIQTLFDDAAFQAFIAACLGLNVIYPFADPMRGLIINTMQEGDILDWHFDANDFVVSLMTLRARTGGLFEYCPHIRKPGDENYGAVKAVLDGESHLVRGLDLQVGDVQIFRGRYSLHRVAPIREGRRHTVIFGYAEEPGFIGSVASTMKVYGRVMQAHIDAEEERHHDGLAD